MSGDSSTNVCLKICLKQDNGSFKSEDDRAVYTGVTQSLTTEDTSSYQRGIEKLITRYDKSLSYGREYIDH
jgi:hypothetical protein